MICPFCQQTEIGDDIGPSVCPACKAGFENDDRGECVFVDRDEPRLPMFGHVCPECGLVQQDKRDACSYCGTTFNKTTH